MPEVLRLADVCKEDARAMLLSFEVANRLFDRAGVDVVRQHDDDPLAAYELARQAQSLGDAARALLPAVLEIVAQQSLEVVDVVGAGDEHQLDEAGSGERVDCPLHHGLVPDRQEVLVGDLRQRIEPRPGAAREDDSLHGDAMLWEPWS